MLESREGGAAILASREGRELFFGWGGGGGGGGGEFMGPFKNISLISSAVRSDHRNFTINHHKSYVVELGFEFATPGSEIRCSTHCTMEPGFSAV